MNHDVIDSRGPQVYLRTWIQSGSMSTPQEADRLFGTFGAMFWKELVADTPGACIVWEDWKNRGRVYHAAIVLPDRFNGT